MKKINELKAGAILSYINLGISCIIPLLYTPIMLEILGQSEYGLYSLSNSVISYLSLLNFGMGSAVTRYITKYRAENKIELIEKTIGLFIVIYSCLALLVMIGGTYLSFCAGDFFHKGLSDEEISSLKILIIIMAISTAVSFPISVYSNVSIAFEKYIFRKIFDLCGTIITPILNLIVLFSGQGSIGLACVGLGMQLLYAPIFIYYCSKKIGINASFRNLPVNLLKEIWVFSAYIFLSGIVDMLYWSTDKILLGAMVGSAAVAIYNVGGVFTSLLTNMAHAISSVFTPRVTTIVVKDNNPEVLSELLIRIGRLQYLIVSFILSGYIVFGQLFIHFWSGDAYQPAFYVALMTMVPISVPLIQSIAFSIIVAQNKHQFRSICYAIIAIINVISTYFAIPQYGLIGAAVCTCIAYTVGQGIIMNIYYYKVTKLDIPNFWANIGKMSGVPVLMILFCYLLINKYLPAINICFFLLEVIVFSILYFILTWFFTLNEYEKNLFKDIAIKVLGVLKK